MLAGQGHDEMAYGSVGRRGVAFTGQASFQSNTRSFLGEAEARFAVHEKRTLLWDSWTLDGRGRGRRLKLGDSGIQDGPDGKLTRTESGFFARTIHCRAGMALSFGGMAWRFHVSVTSRAVWTGSDMQWMSLRAAGAGSVSTL
jgi:hypothetical protein